MSFTNRSHMTISMGNRTSKANAHLNYESDIYRNELADNNQNGAMCKQYQLSYRMVINNRTHKSHMKHMR